MPSLKKRGRPTCVCMRSPVPRLILLSDARSPDGEPRAALLMPGSRLPVVFPSIAAASAAAREARA
ncbi:hypothetical protein AA23498_1198 [Acetobacter nitrogenifigens DSM 23921 = NBRC 105050]|uniref:Uncharacterized protein n=1 Tax=Acetobacter nitrogenifigens DSM 23921 = NBRC 105050 TaxID=1120919 RepID=A0A511XD29_9PROT|nr:hypothetical protein AA23498_1198 [Acetobacter nitrogenifigens DSM 23921 = NBRC 105050]GEN60852.1 hypothetical protein ANI02nite_27360 [Acetobacter nitrogenifigens DSM 23921 = NBRC 105050]